VYDEFTERVLESAREQTVGNGLDEATDIGALITPEHESRVRELIATGVEGGAELLLDGRDISVGGIRGW